MSLNQQLPWQLVGPWLRFLTIIISASSGQRHHLCIVWKNVWMIGWYYHWYSEQNMMRTTQNTQQGALLIVFARNMDIGNDQHYDWSTFQTNKYQIIECGNCTTQQNQLFLHIFTTNDIGIDECGDIVHVMSTSGDTIIVREKWT